MVGGMSLDDKRACMSEIERKRKTAWKYSCFFCLGLMIYICCYDLLSVMYSIKVMEKVVQLNLFTYLIPVIIIVPSIFAHSMNGKWIVTVILAYMFSAFGVIVTGEWANYAAAPFLIAGAVMYYRVSACCEMYNVLSKQEGFPEFYSLEHGAAMAREIIERNSKKDGDLSPLTRAAIELHNAAKSETEPKETSDEQKNIPEGENTDGE